MIQLQLQLWSPKYLLIFYSILCEFIKSQIISRPSRTRPTWFRASFAEISVTCAWAFVSSAKISNSKFYELWLLSLFFSFYFLFFIFCFHSFFAEIWLSSSGAELNIIIIKIICSPKIRRGEVSSLPDMPVAVFVYFVRIVKWRKRTSNYRNPTPFACYTPLIESKFLFYFLSIFYRFRFRFFFTFIFPSIRVPNIQRVVKSSAHQQRTLNSN